MKNPSAAALGMKSRDYWFTVLATDPVARPIVRTLSRNRWLTPDQVSLIALLLGLTTGVFFCLGTRLGLVAGAVTFYLAFLVDCIDGKLARSWGIASPRGEAFDHLADGARRASASLGLTVWLWRSDSSSGDLLWAMAYVVLAYLFLEVSGAEREPQREGLASRWTNELARRRLMPTPGMPDVQAVVFIVGPLTGLVVPALVVGIVMVVAGTAISVKRRVRRRVNAGEPQA